MYYFFLRKSEFMLIFSIQVFQYTGLPQRIKYRLLQLHGSTRFFKYLNAFYAAFLLLKIKLHLYSQMNVDYLRLPSSDFYTSKFANLYLNIHKKCSEFAKDFPLFPCAISLHRHYCVIF